MLGLTPSSICPPLNCIYLLSNLYEWYDVADKEPSEWLKKYKYFTSEILYHTLCGVIWKVGVV